MCRRDEQLAAQDEKVDKAIELFNNLGSTCGKAEPVKLREFLRTAIDKVVVRVEKTKYGRKDRYLLRGGHIHMKLEDLVELARCAEQELKLEVVDLE